MRAMWVLLACLLAAPRGTVQNMVCYSCEYHAGETHKECMLDPESVVTSAPTVNCDKKYCTVIRQEHASTGTVNTFSRGCSDSIVKENGVVIDALFKTYYKTCSTDRCNYGDGKSTNGVVDGGGGGIFVKGRGNGAPAIYPTMAVFITLMFAVLFTVYI
ncbi:uncharacterized protein [Anabrus simplex]|uniref:uncharacterized protein n=1 Tax=Anabrus simplex TaxID=316456 RepID=UPI0034DD63DB